MRKALQSASDFSAYGHSGTGHAVLVTGAPNTLDHASRTHTRTVQCCMAPISRAHSHHSQMPIDRLRYEYPRICLLPCLLTLAWLWGANRPWALKWCCKHDGAASASSQVTPRSAILSWYVLCQTLLQIHHDASSLAGALLVQCHSDRAWPPRLARRCNCHGLQRPCQLSTC